MLHLAAIYPEPLDELAFRTIAPHSFEPADYQLPVFLGAVGGLPAALDALVVASDLQGVVQQNGQSHLLGEVLPKRLRLIFELYFPALDPQKTLVLLAGDLYANLVKRGQGGSPLPVWQQFSAAFGYTVGVAGNHDELPPPELAALRQLPNTHLLLNDVVAVAGLRIGGLSGIIGRPGKSFRLPEAAYVQALARLLARQPQVLLTHLSPELTEAGCPGDARVAEIMRRGSPTTVFCGHSHWLTSQPQPLANGTQVLNADAKVFILTRP